MDGAGTNGTSIVLASSRLANESLLVRARVCVCVW